MAYSSSDSTTSSGDPFVLSGNVSLELLQQRIERTIIQAYEDQEGKPPDGQAMGVLTGNAEQIAALTKTVLDETAATTFPAHTTHEQAAEQIASRVSEALKRQYAATTNPLDPLKIIVDGVPFLDQEGMGETKYFAAIESGLTTSLNQNFAQHAAAFEGMKATQVAALPPGQGEAETRTDVDPTSLLPADEQQEQAAAVEEQGQSTADEQATTASPPATSLPGSLTGIFLHFRDKPPGEMMASFGDQAQLENTIRDMLRQRGQDPADFSDEHIKGLATAIQTGAGRFMQSRGEKIMAGDLSHEQLREYSIEFARHIRSELTPDKVGEFAKENLFGSFPDEIAGVDANGRPGQRLTMNMQGIAEAVLTAQFGSDAAKERYLGLAAITERKREFYGAGSPFNGDAAADAADEELKRKGYSDKTRSIVGLLAREEFNKPAQSGFFGAVGDFFNALLSGNWKMLFEIIKSIFTDDNDYSRARRESDLVGKNVTTWRRIMGSDAASLGYEGPPEQFNQWRADLAADATGIRQRPDGTIYDHDNGTPRGISAAILGLEPDGTIPGTNIVGRDAWTVEQLHRRTTPLHSPAQPDQSQQGRQPPDQRDPTSTRAPESQLLLLPGEQVPSNTPQSQGNEQPLRLPGSR